MKVATAEYEHSKLVLATKPNAAEGKVTVKVGGAQPVDTGIKIANPPAKDNPEAIYVYDAAKLNALLISEIKKDAVLHIFTGKLDKAGEQAKSFTIPEKEVKATADEAAKLNTFADLTKYATDFKWIK